MTLPAGARLGPYEVVGLIGVGGMGEVYRARDPRLGREVAIKVSAERFTEHFAREARAVAALNHPNICTLHDVGPDYLVMELVDGESPRGPLPLDRALPIARQIGDALEAAHEKGIVHRDLKPANIKVKPDGTVKVLDFGLAKVTEAEGAGQAGDSVTRSPTLSQAVSQAGMIVGTAGYMSPEQARGKSVDKRTDIWAFGVVFHELLTGRKLFEGEDVSETLAKVIQADPQWDAVPSQVQRLLKKCLEKDPRRRLRDIGDAWDLLEESPQSVSSRSKVAVWAWATAAAFAVATAIAAWAPWRAARPADQPLVRLDVNLGPDVFLPAPGISPSVTISPDGRRLAYVASIQSGPPRLFTRRLDQPEATVLPGTEEARGPFFSPDGQWIGFMIRNTLNKISVEGGAVVPLLELPSFAGAFWGEDGNIIVGRAIQSGLGRIPSAGGPATTILELANGEIAHRYPHVLPGGQAVLFAAGVLTDLSNTNIDVVNLADRRRKTLIVGGSAPRYLSSGHLIYVNSGTLFAVPFDPRRLETRGNAQPVLSEVAHQNQFSGGEYDVARNGTLVYRRGSGRGLPTETLQWLDRTGARTPVVTKPGSYSAPRVSPDGRLIALGVTEATGGGPWVYDLARDTMTRLTSGRREAFSRPVWSPDGKYIVFGAVAAGAFWTRADGGSQPQPLMQSKTTQVPWSFTPDGKRLAYFEPGGGGGIWTVSIEDEGSQLKSGKPEPFLQTQFFDAFPAFSPDGRWLAYQSNESGRPEVYVRPFPPPKSGAGGKWQISNDGGVFPVWSRTGRELLYRAGDQIMAVSFTMNGDSFVADKPRVWVAKVGGTDWDLAPDGQRLIVVTPLESPEPPKQEHTVVFLQNFFDELRRRVPIE